MEKLEQKRCCSSQPTSQDTTPAVTEYTAATCMCACLGKKKKAAEDSPHGGGGATQHSNLGDTMISVRGRNLFW